MTLLLWGLTIGTLGKVLLGITVLLVHNRLSEEKRIDRAVLTTLRQEQTLGIIGILLIIAGYIMEVTFYTTTGF